MASPRPERQTERFDYVARAELGPLRQWWASGAMYPMAVVGAAGYGKSTLVTMLGRAVVDETGDKRAVTVVGAHRLPDAGALARRRAGRRSLLVVEDVDTERRQRVVSFAERLHARAPQVAVIAVSRSGPWPPPWQQLAVGGMAASELHQLVGDRLSRTEAARLLDASEGSPLLARLLAGLAEREPLDEVLRRVEREEYATLFPSDALFPGPDVFPGQAPSPAERAFDIRVATVSDELIAHLVANPDLLYELQPRRFEELMAELYARQGFGVQLTKQTRDGGYDLIVVSSSALGRFTTLVDAKRYRPDNPVRVGVVRELYGVVEAQRATAGIVATTSFFTPDAKAYQREVHTRLTLRDYFDLQTLLRDAAKGHGGHGIQ